MNSGTFLIPARITCNSDTIQMLVFGQIAVILFVPKQNGGNHTPVTYRHLTQSDRCRLLTLKTSDLSQRAIAP